MVTSRRVPPLMRRRGARGLGGSIPISPAQRANAVIASLGPSFDLEAKNAQLSGGNVASIPNSRGADSLVMAAGTLAAPASDILFGGAQSIAFTGTQSLLSNLAASAWKFLHDGTGYEAFHVYAPTNVAATNSIGGSITGSNPGVFWYWGAAVSVQQQVNNAVPAAIVNIGGGGAPAANTATYGNFYYGASEAVPAGVFKAAALVNSSAAGAPSAANPGVALRIGADGPGTTFGNMRWVRTIILPRVLHEYERQLMRESFQTLYAIAAPSLVGVDRDIMSMLPFSWPRFDSYSTGAGNVLAVLDKARPGHSFSQGTGSNQVANPVASANFNGQLAATFGTNKTYQSSLPAAAWTSLADKAAIYCPFRCTSFAGTQIMLETWNSGNGFALSISQTSGNWNSAVYRPSAGQSTVGLPGNAINVARLYQAHNDTLSLFSKATGLGTNTAAATAGTIGTTTKSLVFGARAGALFAVGESPELGLIFDRVLSASERARVEAYYQTRYNLAA